MEKTICWYDKDRVFTDTCEAYNNGAKIEIVGFNEAPVNCLILQVLLADEDLINDKIFSKIIFELIS